MNKKISAILLLLSFTCVCIAQVEVEVVFDQEHFLRNESLPTKVRVLNLSGQTLHIGDTPDWLQFEITEVAGRAVRQLDKVPLADPFDLASAKIGNLSIDLMPYFDLGGIGQYSIVATLKIPQLAKSYSSKPASFNIINGTKLWEREFGVPSTNTPEVRKYALQQATFLKQLRLYARVTDPEETKVFKVVPLGPIVSFSTPDRQEKFLDKDCNLHVFFQTGARSFSYSVVTPNGDLISRQTFEYADTRPVLRMSKEGDIGVLGGRRRIMSSDIPTPLFVPPEHQPLPPPPATNAPPKSTKKK